MLAPQSAVNLPQSKSRRDCSPGSDWPRTQTNVSTSSRRHQPSIRLSTAFDGPTLYGMDSDADGVFGKIGEGGVAIDTVEDMERLYANFPLGTNIFPSR